MQDQRFGAAFRVVRIRRRWRQQDVADRAGVSRSFVSLVERGHLEDASVGAIRNMGRALDIRVDMFARWRGGELDRLLNAAHSGLHESVIGFFAGLPSWTVLPEVSFSIWGERGVIDILAWHAASRSLLVIELKTDIVDVNDLVGGVDRKRRLAGRVAREHGWDPATVSCWVIVTRDKTNQRRIAGHQAMLRAAFPLDGRKMRSWLHRPAGTVRCLSTWTTDNPRNVTVSRNHRVRTRVRLTIAEERSRGTYANGRSDGPDPLA